MSSSECNCKWVQGRPSPSVSYLPLENGGYAFEWVSNYQVMTPVQHLILKPLAARNRTYTLPAGDKKTVTEAGEKETTVTDLSLLSPLR